MPTLRVPALVVAAVVVAVLGAGCASTGNDTLVGAPSTPAAAPPSAAPPPAAVPSTHPAAATPPTTATPLPAPAPSLVPGTPCTATARACVDISAKQAWLISAGRIAYGPVPITSGRAGYRTPTGTYRVQFKDIDHKSSLFDDAPMPYSVFFNGGVAFHQGSLKALSHGCVHLSPAAAKTFFGSLKVGDVVAVKP